VRHLLGDHPRVVSSDFSRIAAAISSAEFFRNPDAAGTLDP
jgi:hypothetical protein